MSVPRLDNYLRTFRKRAGFTQREVAFLMGSGEGDNHDKLSRLERNKNLPTFESTLAFEVIFRSSLRELFAGRYERVAQGIAERAEALRERIIARERLTSFTAHRLRSLDNLISRS